jgi:hypothetical protein
VEVPGEGQPGPGPTGTTSPTGTTTPTGSPTSTVTGSPTGTATTPPSPACVPRTNDHLEIEISGAITAACGVAKPGGGAPPTPTSFTGQIVKVGPDFIELDTCPPTADCIATYTTLRVRGAGLDLSTLPVSSLVKVTATFVQVWGCESTVLVESLADWYGTKNPVDVGGRTYLVGAEGGTSVAGAPFSVGRVRTYCNKSETPSCGGTDVVDDYALQFNTTTPTLASMGGTVRFVTDAGQIFEARNLRSYYLGYCDEYWDYAFWAKTSYGYK